jgi:hypothetical protein
MVACDVIVCALNPLAITILTERDGVFKYLLLALIVEREAYLIALARIVDVVVLWNIYIVVARLFIFDKGEGHRCVALDVDADLAI